MPAIMFPSSSSSSELVHTLDPKQNPGHLYVRQPHTIIQLTEGPPPPPRPIASVIQSSSAGSSSASSCPSSSTSDEACSSYCSSIMTPDESSHDREPVPWTDDTYNARMERVHAWRNNFAKATETRRPSLKRKTNPQTDDDTVSHTSKRSRSRDDHSICPACDTPFASPADLRKHGCAMDVHEACRVAVAYDFE